MEIIIDHRERHVIPHFDEYENVFHVKFRVDHLEVGDYAICYKNYILVIVERKTWNDLAASMRDGRKHNIDKLINLRNKVNCQIAYLIEGPAMPNQNKLYNRIPYKNLRAHLDHLAFRDSVHMLYSNDENSTALRLMELALNISTDKVSCKEIDDIIKAAVNLSKFVNNDVVNDEVVKDKVEIKEAVHKVVKDKVEIKEVVKDKELIDEDSMNVNEINVNDIFNDNVNGDEKSTIDILKDIDKDMQVLHEVSGDLAALKERQPSTKNVNEQLLRCIPYVGSIISTLMVNNGMSFKSVYNQTHTVDDIATLCYPTGAAIGLIRARKIANIRSILDKGTKQAYKIKHNLLTQIPSVSSAAATAILAIIPFHDLLNGEATVDQIKNIHKTEKTKIGPKTAENILKYLNA